MGRKNAIIESFNRLEDEEEDLGQDELDGDEYEHDDTEELTDDEVVEEVERYDTTRRQVMESSRTRGKATSERQRAGRQTAAKQEAKARQPAREREIDWRPANTLDAPPPRPGMEQRWIRVQLEGESDARNWSRKSRERWNPRKLDTVPEEFAPPTIAFGRLGEVIGVADLILCERPIEIGASRRKFFREKHNRQMSSVTHRHANKAQRGDHEIEVSVKRDRPTRGRGRRQAQVQED